MIINLSPQETKINDKPPLVEGDVLTYRGSEYDLSRLPEGGEVEANYPFLGKIRRNLSGVIELTLQYGYSTSTAEPLQSTDPDDYTFTVENGQCPCPIKRKEAQ